MPASLSGCSATTPAYAAPTNAMAFEKLRNVLMMHYAVRARAAESIGQAGADVLVKQIVEELKKKFGGGLGGPPATS